MTTHDSLLGQQLDEYRLEKLLGRGGMARVYRGLDTRLGRYVAIKVIETSLRTDSEYALRFEREAQAIARLEHPNVVRLYRYGEAQGVLYMAMQYIEGADFGSVLQTYREDGEFIKSAEAVPIIRQVCSALDYIHSQGVIHRDIKPTNIMLNNQGRAILTDFGLALLTEIGTRGEIFGSPHYIAPEQAISSAGAVPQSDLYSVGIMLYEMFTGELPYDAENPMDTAMLHMEGNVTPPRAVRPSISPALEAVILKAMAREPEQRYSLGVALADELEYAVQQTSLAGTTRQHVTVPERVAIELEAHPLPPIPAEVTPAAVPPTTHSAQTPPPAIVPAPALLPRPQHGTLGPSITTMTGIGVGMVVLLGAAVVVLYLLISGGDNGSGSDTPTITALAAGGQVPTLTDVTTTTIPTLSAPPAPTFTALLLPASTIATTEVAAPGLTFALTAPPVILPALTRAPTLTPGPTFPPTAWPTLSPIPPGGEPVAGYGLLVARNGTESLFVVNTTVNAAFPLQSLRLGDGRGAVRGSDWGVEFLQPGQCVAIWRSSGSPRAPNVDCMRVGSQIIRGAEDGFNVLALKIYYQDELIDTCQEERCLVPVMLNDSPSPVTYTLLIATEKDDSLFVVNQSAEAFPLSLLSLGNGDTAINGTEWNLDLLAPGECVTAWKDSGKPKTPDVTCNEVGPRLTRKGEERFWKSSFAVSFRGELVITCEDATCLIEIVE